MDTNHRIPFRTSRTLVVLILFLLSMSLSLTVQADSPHFSSGHGATIKQQPSAAKPWAEVQVFFYSSDGKDGFFLHDNTDGAKGPAVYVDGKKICNPDYELAWPDSDETGNGSGCKSACNNNDSWWGDGYSKTIDGITYTVKFWDPYWSNDRAYVTMVVYMTPMQVGVSHEIKVRGKWKINSISNQYEEYTYKINAVPDIWSNCTTTATWSAYNQAKYEGTLNTSYGATNIRVVSTGNSTGPSTYLSSSSVGNKDFPKGDSSFSLTANRDASLNHWNQGTAGLQYSLAVANSGRPTITLWKPFTTNVIGYTKAKNLKATPNMWKKQIELSWEAEASGRSQQGTWSVYRYPANDASAKELLKSGIVASTLKYTDTSVPEYETNYTYDVVFVPTNTPTGTIYNELKSSITKSCVREFKFTNLSVVSGENSLTFNWQCPAFEGTESYRFSILRTTKADFTDWTEIATVNVSDKSKTKYSYTDKKNLELCPTYYYKVQVTMLENHLFDTNNADIRGGRLTGNSRVTSVSATKGDYAGLVKVTWEAIQVSSDPTQYQLFRRNKGSNSWASIYKTSGTAENYYFEDNTALPGKYYDYKVTSTTICDGSYTDISEFAEGFCRATGIISGRITYGTGTAVPNVKVALIKSDDDNSVAQFYAAKIAGTGGGILLPLTDALLKEYFTDASWSAQFYVRPNATQASSTTPVIFDIADKLRISLGTFVNNKGFPVNVVNGSTSTSTGLYIPADKYTSVTVTKNSSNSIVVYTVNEEGTLQTGKAVTAKITYQGTGDKLGLNVGGSYTSNSKLAFSGFVDEIRIFTGVCLTSDQIKSSYSHTLSGVEAGLIAYWPIDEGFPGQSVAYDYSKNSGVANGHHGNFGVGTSAVSDVLPTEDQLSLFAFTDVEGNYVIRGVPFSGDGTNYTVRPTLGIHEFSPNYASRYVGASSLVHSGVDFTDVSSFPLSGVVYYENTTYPVEGCNLYVDGTICSKEGEMITTDANGAFTISVPIGDHAITIKKNGHTFVNNGRYPADPKGVGTYQTFDHELPPLTFYDNTLVNFSGRIVGGNIQGDLPIGFNLSKNNIGVTEIVMTPMNDNYRMNVYLKQNGTSYTYETNTNVLECPSATSAISSSSWRGAGDNVKKLYIHTDPVSGEFSAMIPPLYYKIESMKVISTGLSVGESTSVDLTNPSVVYTDSTTYSDGATVTYDYNGSLIQVYHSTPTFTVQQEGRTDGSFGINAYNYEDEIGKISVKDIYQIKSGKPVYKYGGPLFVMEDPYTFLLEGYEEYVNSDNKQNPVTDHVPLAGNVVTINNALSADQKVYIEDRNGKKAGDVVELESNQLTLDDEGKATYSWKAGLPNICTPYTRTISISYDIDGRAYQWSGNGLAGIILGSLPTGNNFVTSGPDVVTMILRDPPGTNSFAEWTKGTSYTKMSSEGSTAYTDDQTTMTLKLGVNIETVVGVGFASVNQVESVDDLEIGVHVNVENESATTASYSTTTTRTISTSDAPEYVGAMGDVFIGSATNILFGKARNVGFKRSGTTNTVSIAMEDVVTTGMSFNTAFSYTEYYIENVLIPNLILMRNSMLKKVSSSQMASYVNNTDKMVYLTTLSPSNAKYGSSNTDKAVWGNKAVKNSLEGPSYRCVPPKNMKQAVYEDSVNWINTQIANWKEELRRNEAEKVKAYEDRSNCLAQNISFDSGTRVTYSQETSNSHGTSYEKTVSAGAVLNNEMGFAINKLGCLWKLNVEAGGGTHDQGSTETTETTAFSYTLAEEGDDDAITVDVFNYGAFGPIFRTRGGQTCGPYEGKVVTKYYQPGTTIMEATMQIEVPQITVDEPNVSDVPSGSAANYTLRLSNASEIDEDVYYKLLVIDESNPHGAQISIDGKTLTDNRIIKIPAGETITKALQLRQTNTGILEYKNIGIVLASQTQYDNTSTWDQIADTVYISAQFVPSSSEVNMVLSNTVLNTSTGADLSITFKDFDRNYNNLKAFRIQYRRPGDTSWTLVREYVVNQKDKTASNELLPAGANITYTLPMEQFADGQYTFRVLSVSTYGTSEVFRTSEEITLTKDMARPQPLTLPAPTDGILNAGDQISVLFNEDLRSSGLNAADNFIVQGDLNDATIAHDGVFASAGGSGAHTSAAIDLASRSFTWNFWINWSKEGTILRHGTANNALSLAVNASGNLVITNGSKTHTSSAAIPKDKWCYVGVTMNYNAGKPVISAAVAYDATTKSLFDEASTPVYTGNGTLTVGEGITAAIHELTLWNFARTFEEAQSTMYTGKAASTDGLIGYWKLSEGHGVLAEDIARSRHLTLASPGDWRMAAANIGVALDGKSYAAINVSGCSSINDDNWLIELWFKGTKPTATATLVNFGDTDFDLRLTAAGTMQVVLKGATYEVSSANYADGSWHHLAVNVLKGTSGFATIYVDGTAVHQLSADLYPAVQADRIILGARRQSTTSGGRITYSYSQYWKGTVDEFRYWKGTFTKATIVENMHNRLSGNEAGLEAYYPFEKMTLDSYNQIVVTKDKADHTGSGLSAEIYNSSNTEPAWQDNAAPALKTAPSAENVSFSFVANERQIVITLEENAARLEGSTISFTLRNITDVNGNYILPVTWTAYVKQNSLTWSESSIDVRKEGTDDVTFSVEINNASGNTDNWTISGLPTWLSADVEAGTLTATGTRRINFTVNGATAIGRYEATVLLTGSNGVSAPLVVTLTSVSEKPDWTVNAKGYEFDMNMVGQIRIDGVFSEDPEDMVAAFIGGECRGVASPVYFSRYDACFVMLCIFGNAGDEGKEVVFKVFDASTGILYPSVQTTKSITFTRNDIQGTVKSPFIWTPDDKQEQSLVFDEGWNWISLNVVPQDSKPSTIFRNVTTLTTVKDKSSFTNYSNGNWAGDLTSMTTGVMYKVNASEAVTVDLIGVPVDPSSSPVTIANDWNWIGFNSRSYMTVNEAFAELNPEDGDIVKGQGAFSVYNDYEWVGTLNTLVPGRGYIYRSLSTKTKTFHYPEASSSSLAAQSPARRSSAKAEPFRYAGDMSIIAQVTDGEHIITDAVISVYAGDELRGFSGDAVLDDIHFISVQGEGAGTPLRVVIEAEGNTYTLEGLTFRDNDVIGGVKNPMRFNIGATGIQSIQMDDPGEVYDLFGRRVIYPQKGTIYIINGEKKMF